MKYDIIVGVKKKKKKKRMEERNAKTSHYDARSSVI